MFYIHLSSVSIDIIELLKWWLVIEPGILTKFHALKNKLGQKVLVDAFSLSCWFTDVQVVVYRKTSNIRCTLVGNKIVDHSDVVGASPVGAAPTTSSFSTKHLASRDSAKTAARQYEDLLSVGIWCGL